MSNDVLTKLVIYYKMFLTIKSWLVTISTLNSYVYSARPSFGTYVEIRRFRREEFFPKNQGWGEQESSNGRWRNPNSPRACKNKLIVFI